MREVASGDVLLGRYAIERRLGAGSNGAVWLARDLAEGGAVAVKVLHAHLAEAPLTVDRFSREAEVLLRLAHPAIARARALHRSAEGTWVVLELAGGRSLDRVIGDRTIAERPFTDAEVWRIFTQLADGVAYAHAQGVLHRDLKPLNVMVDEDAELAVKLLDFGLAKLLAPDDRREATTRGRQLGSFFYMSPEQVRGEPVDARSDQFALASVLFELLTLRRAWVVDGEGARARAFDAPLRAHPANAPTEVSARILTGERPRVSRHRAGAASLDGVVARAMAVAPEERYPDVASFEAAVRAALQLPARDAEGSITEALEASLVAPTMVRTSPMIAPPQRVRRRVWPLAMAGMLAVAVAAWAGGWAPGVGEDADRPALMRAAPSPSAPSVVQSVGAASAVTHEVVAVTGTRAASATAGSAASASVASEGAVPQGAAAGGRPLGSIAVTASPLAAPALGAHAVAASPAVPASPPAAPAPAASPTATPRGSAARARASAAARAPARSAAPPAAPRPYARLWSLLGEAKSTGAPELIGRLGDAIVGAAAADVDDVAARTRIRRLAESSALVGDLAGLELALMQLERATR